MRRSRPLLGTYVEVCAEGLPEAMMERAIDAAFGAVELVHKLMSFHDLQSDVTSLNRRAAIEPVEIHPWTAHVIRRALALFHATGGLFDCAIGAELVRWELLPDHGFAGLQSGRLSALRFVGRNRIVFDAPVAIDLGGIAKGFAVDRAIATLRRHGVRTAVVNAGGDLRVMGREGHPIYIRDPINPSLIRHAGVLRNGSIATSSAAQTRKITGGTEVSALVCAARHEPLVERNAYSVIAPTCTVADALTKVLAQVRTGDAAYFGRFGATALITVPCRNESRAA